MIWNYSDLRTKRKSALGTADNHDKHHLSPAKILSKNSKKRGKATKGRRGRKGKKRGTKSSQALKSTSNSHSFKPVEQQRNSKKLKQLDRNPRQQQQTSSLADPLKIVMSNQIIQVSQEKDRKYHFE